MNFLARVWNSKIIQLAECPSPSEIWHEGHNDLGDNVIFPTVNLWAPQKKILAVPLYKWTWNLFTLIQTWSIVSILSFTNWWGLHWTSRLNACAILVSPKGHICTVQYTVILIIANMYWVLTICVECFPCNTSLTLTAAFWTIQCIAGEVEAKRDCVTHVWSITRKAWIWIWTWVSLPLEPELIMPIICFLSVNKEDGGDTYCSLLVFYFI